nr:hypothetical protein [Tanacetum cinerariifolium]
MDLLSFIQTADPTKVRVAERQRVEDETRILESTVGRASRDGQGTDIQPVIATTDTIVEDVAPLQPRRQRKRKTVVADASGPSHPPKKLREDYGALGRASTAECEDKSPADSVTRLNLRTIGAPQRSSAPAIATVTTVTASVDVDTTADRVPNLLCLVLVHLQLVGLTLLDDSLDDSRICREMLDEFAHPNFFASVRGMDHDQLFTEFNVRAAHQISLSAEVRMRAEYNIREKRRLRTVVDEQAELLKGEVGVLRDHSATLEREKNKLSVKVTDLSASVKVREQEVADLDAQVTAVKYMDRRFLLPGFKRKLLRTRILLASLRNFKIKNEEVNEKFDKLYVDFVDMALHLEEKFYPHLLTTISGRRWLLSHGMELAVVRCLNSTEYLSALGATISKAIEKRLQNVNFSLIAELKSNKDASVDTIINLLCLDDALAERLGLTESQPHANQLMVPIHHSPDQRVIALCDVFVPLSEPLSAVALEGNGYDKKGTKSKQNRTKLSTKQKAWKSQQSEINKKSNLAKSKPKKPKSQGK